MTTKEKTNPKGKGQGLTIKTRKRNNDPRVGPLTNNKGKPRQGTLLNGYGMPIKPSNQRQHSCLFLHGKV